MKSWRLFRYQVNEKPGRWGGHLLFASCAVIPFGMAVMSLSCWRLPEKKAVQERLNTIENLLQGKGGGGCPNRFMHS